MPTYGQFEEFKHRAQKHVLCSTCGKKVRRQITLVQVRSPWNKDRLGNPKTPQQVREDLVSEAQAWKSRPETCKDCTEN